MHKSALRWSRRIRDDSRRIFARRDTLSPINNQTFPLIPGFLILCVYLTAADAKAAPGDATWSTSAVTNFWEDSSNWSPGIPSTTGTATFGNSNITTITALQPGVTITIGEMLFTPAAPAYNFLVFSSINFIIQGTGIVNNSSFAPTFTESSAVLQFTNNATAGDANITADSAGQVVFRNNSTAGTATITANATASIFFEDQSSAPQAHFIIGGSAILDLSLLTSGAISLGSIQGPGTFSFGSAKVTVGSTVASGSSTEVSGTIADGGVNGGIGASLIKAGTGTLILSGNNTYSGGTTISQGTLQLGNGGTAGSILGNVTDNAVFAINRSDAFTFSGNISGTGSFQQIGSGTTILSGNNTYSGITAIGSSTLAAGSTTAFSPSSAFIVNGNGTLNLNGFNNTVGSLEGSGIVTNASQAAVLSVGNNDLSTTFSGTMTDGTSSLALTKIGTGTLTLTGANTYTGGTTIGQGTLQLGNGGTTGSILGDVTDNAVFAIDRSDTFTFSGNISGTGSFQQIGSGTTILSGNNTYSGTTIVTSGTLTAGSTAGFSPNSAFIVNGTLNLNGFNNTVGSLAGSGIVTNASQTAAILSVGNNNKSTTFSGTITDGTSSLALTKIGTGALTLTGANTYTGGTTIRAGTLQIGNGGTTGSIIGNVTNNGTLGFDRSNAYTFVGTITGTGNLVESGTGTLTLAGKDDYSGGTVLESGALVVDNPSALGTGNMIVDGGVLTADPQPINVKGNYFQSPNGTLQLQIAGANSGQFSYLSVTGNATLGGTLELINQKFQPQAGQSLTLVKTGGVITSTFSHFVDPFTTHPGLNTIELVYSKQSVTLEFLNLTPSQSSTINFLSFAQTPNQLVGAQLLDAIELDPRASGLIGYFLAHPLPDIPAELDLFSPEALSAFYEISFSNANIQRLMLEDRLDALRTSSGSASLGASPSGNVGLEKDSGEGKTAKNPIQPVLQPSPQYAFGVWANGFGDFVNLDSDFNARGYRFTTGGFDVGVDYRFLDHFAIGLVGSYSHTWTDLRPGTISVNSGRGGLYATYFNGGYYFNGGVYGGYNTYDTSRQALGGNATGNTDGAEWSTFVNTGYDFHYENLVIGPMASLQYTNVYVTDFTETGSVAPLQIHSDSEESLRTDLGFKASYPWQIGSVMVAPYLKAAWEHEFKYSALPVTAGLADIPGPAATFVGPAEGHDSAVLSTGVAVHWTPRVSTYAEYDGQLGRARYDSNTVTGGVQVSW